MRFLFTFIAFSFLSSFVRFSAQGDMFTRSEGGLLSTWQYYDNMAPKKCLSLSTYRELLERQGLPDVILTASANHGEACFPI